MDKYSYAFWSTIAALLVILILGSFYLYDRKEIKMAELGYERTAIAGYSHPVWQKGGQ